MSDEESFPFAPSSVTLARRFVAERLEALPSEVIESVSLIVSELATNSIRHARTGFTLRIDLDPREVRIAVTDFGEGQPHIGSPQATEPSGRGLRIVELLANNWGVIPSTAERGKTVWFTANVQDPKRRLQDAQ
jgi:anti-sigma regulatory factor (Ser/Thr protein kinase)